MLDKLGRISSKEASADAKFLAQNLANPAREAILAAGKDATKRSQKRPYTSFFNFDNTYITRRRQHAAAGSSAELDEAHNILKRFGQEEYLDDKYLATLVETEAQRSERARLAKTSREGRARNIGAGIGLPMYIAAIPLLLIGLAPPNPIFLGIAGALLAASLISMGVGALIDSVKSWRNEKRSYAVGQEARKDFEKDISKGLSKEEAVQKALDRSEAKAKSHEKVKPEQSKEVAAKAKTPEAVEASKNTKNKGFHFNLFTRRESQKLEGQSAPVKKAARAKAAGTPYISAISPELNTAPPALPTAGKTVGGP